MKMRVYFPGGKKVFADYLGYTHETDQSEYSGGEATAPSPFQLFLASIGTCTGIYVLNFCQMRNIDTQDIEIIQELETDQVSRMIKKINIEIKLPNNFPDKYKSAIIQTAGLCAVKKHLENPPEFEISVIKG